MWSYFTRKTPAGCHAVFSRIDANQMKAVNLPFFKNKLMAISRELYLEQGWELPQGFIDREKRNPLNFSLQEWQQAQRLDDDPRIVKRVFKACWSESDNAQTFNAALAQYGYCLAKGDRRGFVAVDWRGEIYSLSRWCDVKTKALKDRLGDANALPTIKETQARLDRALVERMRALHVQIKERHAPQFATLKTRKDQLKQSHSQERVVLQERQQTRQAKEHAERQSRFSMGLRGVWNRVTGHHANIKRQNEQEAYQCAVRDRTEKDELIFRQIEARREWKRAYTGLHRQYHEQLLALRHAVFSKLPEQKIERLKREFGPSACRQSRDFGPELR